MPTSNQANEFIDRLKRDGFANYPGYFRPELVTEVGSRLLDVLKWRDLEVEATHGDAPSYTMVPAPTPYGGVSSSALGWDKVVDGFCRDLFAGGDFLEICEEMLGRKFRIYTFHARQANSDTKLNGLHQDFRGDLSFCIPINSISADMPTTFFVPGSHLFPHSPMDTAEGLPKIAYKGITKPYVAQVGDLGAFFNKTWHGMMPGTGTSTIILMNLVLEEGAPYRRWSIPKKTYYGEKFSDAVGADVAAKLGSASGIYRHKDLSFTRLTSSVDDGRVMVLPLGRSYTGRVDYALSSIRDHSVSGTYMKDLVFRSKISPRSIILSLYIRAVALVWFRLARSRMANILRRALRPEPST